MKGRTYNWKGAWSSDTKRVMRGMGLAATDMRRVVARPAKKTTPARARSKAKARMPAARKPAATKKPAPTIIKRKAKLRS